MAKRTSRGAEFLARERGLVRPGFTSTCARLFQERGNPWRSEAELDRDYPGRRSRAASQPLQPHETAAQAIANQVRAKLGLKPQFIEPVSPAVVVDPDFSAYFAERAEPKEAFVNPPSIASRQPDFQRKVSAIHRRVVNQQLARALKEAPLDMANHRPEKPERIFGKNGYEFEAKENTKPDRRRYTEMDQIENKKFARAFSEAMRKK